MPVLIVALLLSLLSAKATAETNISTAQELLSRLDNSSKVNVIVTFDALRKSLLDSTLEPVSESPGKRAASHSSRVANSQSELLRTLSPARLKHVRRFKHLPQMALSVDSATLRALLKNPGITVSVDRPMKPFLFQSVPHVFSTQSVSPYNGNNEWAVAVLDTGVEKLHTFLAGKVISEACYSDAGDTNDSNATESLCPGGEGFPSSTDAGSGEPCDALIEGCDHGTHVAGIAVGDSGVAKLGQLVSIKVASKLDEFPNGSANDNDLCYPADVCTVMYTKRSSYYLYPVEKQF